ncbi:MAG: hypothetical protein ACXAC2_06200, partial [Candidatus Kariarchaeaceae archaeon]
MSRSDYLIFSKGTIGQLTLANRLVRSATWDPSIIRIRKMTNEVLNLYRDLSLGGIGLIITGGIPVFKARSIINGNLGKWIATYNDLKVEGIEQLAHVVHSSNKECRIIAQLENG